MGYYRAGFDVVGVDNRPMPRYPFEFHQSDALEYCAEHGHEFDAIHASPPCQDYIKGLKEINRLRGRELRHVNLIPATREAILRTGKLYVIENVIHAPLKNPVRLCGSSFGLKVRRHRHFETNWFLMGTPCWHGHQNKAIYPCSFGKAGFRDRRHALSVVVQVYGKSKGRELWPEAMGIDWMSMEEMSQAIPPAYCEFIGRQLMRVVRSTPDEEPTEVVR
jgi:DNA (cytosine-5)-methyltransferase 1